MQTSKVRWQQDSEGTCLVAYLKGFYPDWSREDMKYKKEDGYGAAVGDKD